MARRLSRALMLASALALTAPAALAQEEQPLSPKQVEAVKKLIHDTIMQNPELIGDAIGALREKIIMEQEANARKALAERKDDLYSDPDAPVLGNPEGDVTLVEFFDYRCTYCKAVYDGLMDAVKADGKVKLVMKEHPILGPDSTLAARAALASRAQNKYPEFHRALMKLRGAVNEQSIMRTAAETGLDVEKLKEDMKAPEIDAILKRNDELAQSLNVTGTPAFVIGERVVAGAVDQTSFKTLFEQQRTKE